MTSEEKIFNLVTELNIMTDAYDKGEPIISDKEWDDLYFELEELEKETGIYLPNSPTQKINYQVVSELKKVTHNHPMLSLAKTKDWDEFLNYFKIEPDIDVIGMVKLDGLTCSLQYLNGSLIAAETRGDGKTGEDILHNARVIKSIPKKISYKEELVIDGEIICTDSDFSEFANDYKNSRNFASGSIRLLDSKECAKRKLTFVAWNVVKGFSGNSFLDKLERLSKLGFLITPWTINFYFDAKYFLENQAEQLGYPIDGLVGRFDDIEFGENLGATAHHTNAAYSFKFYDEEYETRLKAIDWTMGRTGTLTPVAVFDPVEIDGTIVERASLHNLSIMKRIMGDCCWAGQPIKVFKSNMIIPQVSSAEKMSYKEVIAEKKEVVDGFDGELKCPVCGGSTDIKESDSGVLNLVCANPQCEGKLINRLDHFCGKKGLDIKGLSKATLEKLISWNWVGKISDIFFLRYYKKEWCEKEGFGLKSVDNILMAINRSKKCSLSSFISSLGIPLIGTSASKALEKNYRTWDNFIEDATLSRKFKNHILSLDGFGIEMADSLASFNYEEAIKIAEELSFEDTDHNIFKEETLKDITIVITGKLNFFTNRDELKKEIEDRGGKVVGSVSSKTNILINNNINSTTGKNKKAKELDIPIYSEEEFVQKYLT